MSKKYDSAFKATILMLSTGLIVNFIPNIVEFIHNYIIKYPILLDGILYFVLTGILSLMIARIVVKFHFKL